MITVELHWLTSVKPKSSEVKQMPNIESAIKRVRTSANANAKNSSQTNAMRTAIKKFEEAVAAGADNVDALYNEAVDMAATKGLIHKNKANRDKIRLSKLAK